MAVRFVLGRAGAGKTHHCLQSIAAAMRDGESKLVLIVPEQASFQMERALASRCAAGGYFRAEVLSFSRLAQRIFDELGAPPVELSPAARRMALRAIALREPGLLSAFGKAAATSGFFAQLDRLIEELLGENVVAAELARIGAGLADASAGRRLRAIAAIYAAYVEWLGPERIDPAARLAALRQRLSRVEWLDDASIWIDGFAGFTGQELETLVVLADRAAQTTITLLLDPQTLSQPAAGDDALRIFRKTERTYVQLRRRFDDGGISVELPLLLSAGGMPRFRAAALARLERSIAGDLAAPVLADARDGEAISVVECDTPRDEVRAAARDIRSRVIESGGAVAFGDFALVCRDVGRFAPLVAEVFAEYEIPCFLDQRRAIGAHPLCRLVRALLDAAISDCSAESMLRLIRSGLAGVSREEAEDLEHAVLTSEISGLDTWRLPAWKFAEGISDEFLGPARRRIVRAVEGLHALAQRSAAPGGADWVRQLFAGIRACEAAPRLEKWIREAESAGRREDAEIHRACWGRLCELLDDFDAVLGATELGATLFADVIDAGLGEISAGLTPPTLDQVLVGSIERSRHPEIKHIWLVGFNEGVFPQPPGDDGILSAAERESISISGVESLAPRRDDVLAERMLAYIAFTRPSHGLTITYSRSDANGDAMAPSPLLEDVWAALPGLTAKRPDDASPPACAAELARELLACNPATPAMMTRGAVLTPPAAALALRQSPTAHDLRLGELAAALGRDRRQQARLEGMLSGRRYTNSPPKLALPKTEAPCAWSGSPSEIETYVQCPFRHFADRRLRIQTTRSPRPLEQELGSVAHEALAMVTRSAIASKKPVATIADEQWLRWLDEALGDMESRAPADLARRRPRIAYLMRRLGELLRDTLLAHAHRWRIGTFEPLAVEAAFQPDRPTGQTPLPPLELTLFDGRKIRIIGRIDRVDQSCSATGAKQLLIYDYKSTAAWFDAPFLTGMRLASFAYFLAVENAFPAPRSASGVLIAPLYPSTAAFEVQHVAKSSPDVQRAFAFRPRGLFDEHAAAALDPDVAQTRRQLREADDDAGALPRNASDKTRSETAAITLKKDGDFTQNSDVCTAADLEKRAELARRTIRKSIVGLTAGVIDVAPLVEKKTLACYTCDFRPVCRYDPLFNLPRAAERHLPQLDSEPAEEERSATERPHT